MTETSKQPPASDLSVSAGYRHSSESPRKSYNDEACSVCCECGELINPDEDGHEMTCSTYVDLISDNGKVTHD